MGEEETEDPGSKVVEEMAVQLLREIIRERKKLLMVEMNKAKKRKMRRKRSGHLRK